MIRLGAKIAVLLLLAALSVRPSHVHAQPGMPGRTINGGMPGAPAMGMQGGFQGRSTPGMGGGMGGNPGMGMLGGTPGDNAGQQAWACTSCGRTVGSGPTPPNIERCPHCGTRIGYYQDGSGKHDMPGETGEPIGIGKVLSIILGFLVGGAVVVGVILAILKGTSSGKKKKLRRKRIPNSDW
jgi:DNA-directed RNA polymerase subunit RPC12/RpoP